MVGGEGGVNNKKSERIQVRIIGLAVYLAGELSNQVSSLLNFFSQKMSTFWEYSKNVA